MHLLLFNISYFAVAIAQCQWNQRHSGYSCREIEFRVSVYQLLRRMLDRGMNTIHKDEVPKLTKTEIPH